MTDSNRHNQPDEVARLLSEIRAKIDGLRGRDAASAMTPQLQFLNLVDDAVRREGLSYRTAVAHVAAARPDLAAAYEAQPVPTAKAVDDTQRAATDLLQLAKNLEKTQGLQLRDAIREAGRQDAAATEAYQQAFNVGGHRR